MRRPAAALAATSVLAVTSLLGPSIGAAPAPADATVSCADARASTATACALMGQLGDQLGILAPVLDLAGPTLADLGAGTRSLAALLGADGAVPAGELRTSALAVSGLLDTIPEPLRGIVGGGPLGDLATTLDALVAELDVLLQPVVGPITSPPTPAHAEASGPAAAPAPSPEARSTSSAAPTGFGGSLSGSVTVGGTASSIPDVPVGGTLDLGSLAVPEFDLRPADPIDLPAQRSATGPVDELVEQTRLASDTIEEAMPDNGGGALAAVAAMSALLVGGAGVAQLRQRRHVIPD